MYTTSQIINSMSFNNPNVISLLIGFVAANSIGMLEYFWAVALTIKEKKGPFPVWMHTFFLAHDSTAAIVFSVLAIKNDFFWLFSVFAIGMYVWTAMEIYCLAMEVKYSRQENWQMANSTAVSKSYAIKKVVQQVIIMYCVINVLRYLMQDTAMFMWLPLTNFVMAIGPGYMLDKRQSREGSSVFIYILIIMGTFLNFAPKGIGFFSSILPTIFNQPIWFATGIICMIIAVINLIKILRLPAKSQNLSRIW